jgi:hypothetical protein
MLNVYAHTLHTPCMNNKGMLKENLTCLGLTRQKPFDQRIIASGYQEVSKFLPVGALLACSLIIYK